MNYIAIITLAVGFFSNTQAQESKIGDRYITVTGTAEMNVQPDIVTLEITIRESSTERLEKSEKKFNEILAENHISSPASLEQTNSYYWYDWWWNYRRGPVLWKKFQIQLNGKTDYLGLMKDLNQDWVQHISIAQSTHSRIQELREEVKIEAIRAARRKAAYLLESIDEQIGKVIWIEELQGTDQQRNYPAWYYGNQSSVSTDMYSNSVVSYTPSVSSNGESGDVSNVRTIPLKYAIKASFSIK